MYQPPCLLSTGELKGHASAKILQSNKIQHFPYSIATVGFFRKSISNIIFNIHVRKQRVFLKYHPNLSFFRRHKYAFATYGLVPNDNFTIIRSFESRH